MTAYASIGAAPPEPIVAPEAHSYSDTYVIATPAGSQKQTPLKDWVFARLQKEGISTSIADKVISCESGWRTDARHLNQNGTWDIGLWQINDVHGMSEADRLDPYKNTEAAINLIKSSRGWSHWTCFTKSYPQSAY